MKTKTTLMTVSFLTLMAVSMPAMADTNVLCSVRANAKNVAGANYTPGVDAKGKPVAPADVSASPVNVPKVLTIPLTVDLAQRMNEVLPAGAKLEGQMGLVEVQSDGRVMINGKDMTGPADTMCTTIAKQKAAAMKTEDTPKKPVHKKKPVAKPVEAVTAEPMPPEAPKVEEAAAPAAAPAPAVQAEPVPPQVLNAQPPATPPAPNAPQPAPVETPPAPAPAPAPAPGAPTPPPPGAGIPTPPPSGAAVPPAPGTLPAPAPLDPLSPPSAANPAPVPPAPNNNGTLSGGAQ